jgi:hypothetical protein
VPRAGGKDRGEGSILGFRRYLRWVLGFKFKIADYQLFS